VLRIGAQAQQQWQDAACHDLKHKRNGARLILRELKDWVRGQQAGGRLTVQRTITYFENNMERMRYWQYQKTAYPIGSGVTEAACKTLVKQRFCQSGMRWKMDNAQGMLITRALISTEGRWEQFWKKYMA